MKSKPVWIILTTTFLLSFFTGCHDKKHDQSESGKMIGVKVYKIDRELKSLFKEWDDSGINTVLASPSVINDRFTGLARKHNIKIFLILPVFYNPEILKVSQDLYAVTDKGEKAADDWVEFVCPSREGYRKTKTDEIVQLVKDLDPDGISLDFIRFFCFWEKVYPDRDPDSIPNTCFCKSCLKKFQMDKNISIPASLENVSDISKWITENHLAEWTSFKCSLISGMAGEIVSSVKKIKPGIMVNLHIVPWRQDDFNNAIMRIVGQDVSALAEYADLISPMTYSHMLKRDPAWVQSVVKDLSGQVNCKVVPSIQVNEAYLNSVFTDEEFEQTLKEALKPPSSGVFFWSWEQLEARPSKKEILKKYCQTNSLFNFFPPPHSSLFTPHASRFTPHVSRLTPHASRLTPHASRLTPHASRLTPHASRLTLHAPSNL
jgi:hypothetical protein